MNFKLNEIFHSYQSEGFHAGGRALFVRFPFCNLKCKWCDTDYDSYKEYTLDSVIAMATIEATRFCVITGGEPAMNKQVPILIKELDRLNYFIAMETNGTLPIPEGIDWVTVSPKPDVLYRVCDDALYKAHEFKYVVDDDFNFNILDRHDKHSTFFKYLSPEWTNLSGNLKKIIEYQWHHPEWRISLQTHKWTGQR
jgi:organic radical activating enzyme